MWERAEIADQLLKSSNNTITENQYYALGESMYDYVTDQQRFFNRETTTLLDQNYVTAMYEEILLEFPEGFYAHYAREKLQENEAQNL